MKLIMILFLLSLFKNSDFSQILAIFATPGKSHMVQFESIVKRLVTKGHEVDVVSHFPLRKQIPGYNDISIRGTIPLFENNVSISFIQAHLGNMYKTMKTVLTVSGDNFCKAIFISTVGNDLKNTKKKYDLVITHIFDSYCTLGFAHYFKVPVVTIITTATITWGGNRHGNSDNPSYILNHFLMYINPLNFLERLISTATTVLAKLAHHITTKIETHTGRKFFGPNLPSIEELSYNSSLLLINSHFSINSVQPMVSNVIEIGGMHIKPPKPLPKHLEAFVTITSQYKGVIYLSMGTLIVSETFAPKKLQALFDAFSELPYKVLWKADWQNISKLDIPSNVQFEPWLPQLDLLCHPNIKLFVTHGGVFGTQESTYCGVPRLGIPLFIDQSMNIKIAEVKGLAIMVEYDNITKENILNAARHLLESPKYKYNAHVATKLFNDRPVFALDKAIYWIEYIIRHKGAPHLRSDATNLPWYQYMLIDVIFIVIAFLSVFIMITYYVLSKYIFGRFCNK